MQSLPMGSRQAREKNEINIHWMNMIFAENVFLKKDFAEAAMLVISSRLNFQSQQLTKVVGCGFLTGLIFGYGAC